MCFLIQWPDKINITLGFVDVVNLQASDENFILLMSRTLVLFHLLLFAFI